MIRFELGSLGWKAGVLTTHQLYIQTKLLEFLKRDKETNPKESMYNIKKSESQKFM